MGDSGTDSVGDSGEPEESGMAITGEERDPMNRFGIEEFGSLKCAFFDHEVMIVVHILVSIRHKDTVLSGDRIEIHTAGFVDGFVAIYLLSLVHTFSPG